MLNYKLYQDNRSNAFFPGAWYAHVNVSETIDLERLAEHMAAHSCPFSKGTIKGVLTDMVDCIKELTLQGMAVKVDNLAIFSLGIKSKPADSAEAFNAKTHIAGCFLRARATGQFTKAQLKHVVNVSEMNTYKIESADDNGSQPDAGKSEATE